MEPGTRLGAYEVKQLLGKGGMGEVYRAHDSRLGRDVALKVMSDGLESDTSWKSRFRREAKVLASLEHPCIATVYEFAEADGVSYIAMELVRGESLAELLKRGPLGPERALELWAQVAQALDAAHLAGVVHRDVKPANVLLTQDGEVRVVDFGIARWRQTATKDLTTVPTETALPTGEGVLLGTLPYMSPEQLRGDSVDARADVWALGCLLYECLVGRGPFARRTVAEVTSAVLTEEPEWSALPRLSESVVNLLERLLRKDARARLRSAGDAVFILSDTAEASAPQRSDGRQTLYRMAGFVVVVLLSAAAAWLLKPSGENTMGTRLPIALPAGLELGTFGSHRLAISPDGTRVAFSARKPGASVRELYLQRLDSPEQHVVPNSEGARAPTFSPDGRWLAYFVGSYLYKVGVDSGAPTIVCDNCDGRGASWGPDGFIYFGTPLTGLRRIGAEGGPVETVTETDPANGDVVHRFPRWVPGSNAIVFSVFTGGHADDGRIELVDVSTRARKILIEPGVDGQVLPGGLLVFGRHPNLMVTRFDVKAMAAVGEPVPANLRAEANRDGNGEIQLAVSTNGTLIYQPEVPDPVVELVRLRSDGTKDVLAAPQLHYGAVEGSPDGTQLAVVARQRRWRVGVYDLNRSSFDWMSEDNVNADPVVWTREGDLLYTSQGTPSQILYTQTPVAGASPQRLYRAAGRAFAIARHPNGNVLFLEQRSDTHIDVLEIDGASGEVRTVINTPVADRALALSPDGRWLALLFPDVGGDLFVQRYSDGSARTRISTDGADWAEWNRAGDRLYYTAGERLMSVAVEPDAEQPFGTPTLVARIDSYALWGIWGRVAILGRDEFVFMRVAEERPPTDRFVLATRWLEELDALVGDGR